MKMNSAITRLFCLMSSAITFLSCSTREEDSSIPESRVYFKTGYDEYTRLLNPGSYLTFRVNDGNIYATNTYLGYGGIIIYRDFEGKIHSCDLSCPVEASRNVLVTVSSSLQATCDVCGSVFELGWGLATPSSGPAKETLKIYTHVTDNGSAIIVSN